MSVQDFWINVRRATTALSPWARIDSQRIDAADIERELRALPAWLNSKCAEGFNPDEFSFLPEANRKKLASLVRRVREVASKVPLFATATPEQVDRAVPPFLEIIAMLEFQRYADADAYIWGKQIERFIVPYRPPILADLRFETGLDHTSDPGIWIWMIVTDAAVEVPEFRTNTNFIRRLLDTASRAVAPERWPYIRLRTVAEQAEIEGVVAA